MPRIRTMPTLLALIALAATNASRATRAEECLTGPNAQSPQGSHWYYRIDRATHRKCWYLGALRAEHRRTARVESTTAARGEDAPAREVPPAAAPQTGILAAPPDPGFGSRGVAEPPRATAEAAPASPAPPAQTAAPPPVRLAPRTVATTTERVRPPAPAKPAEAAPPAAAAAVPAPASAARGALPAALFAVALLLASVGTMLVRARRRFIRVSAGEATRSAYARAARPTGRARRSLSDILAQAERGEPPSAAARQASFFQRIRRGPDENVHGCDEREARPVGHFVRAADYASGDAVAPDIAAATLQPAIEEMPPEAPGSKSPGIMPAPDVEQSLRQLLAAWERRAA
jgi:hypothetical protein